MTSPSNPQQQQRYRLASDVRYRTLDDEGVVIRQDEGEALVLNEVGCRILALAERGLLTTEIADRLAEEFEEKSEVVHVDVATFLAELADLGILVAQ